MGAMSGIKAVYGLSGSGVPSGVNVSGTQRIGVSQADVSFPTADINYSFTVVSGDPADTAILSLATGAIDTDGTAAEVTRRGTGISDFAALDFEGAALPGMVTLYAIIVSRTETPVDVVSVAFQDTSLGAFSFDETTTGHREIILTSGYTFGGSDEMTMTFAAAGDSLTVTVAGKSS